MVGLCCWVDLPQHLLVQLVSDQMTLVFYQREDAIDRSDVGRRHGGGGGEEGTTTYHRSLKRTAPPAKNPHSFQQKYRRSSYVCVLMRVLLKFNLITVTALSRGTCDCRLQVGVSYGRVRSFRGGRARALGPVPAVRVLLF